MISVQKKIQVHSHNRPAGHFGIRGDTIMWIYTDLDGEARECLVVAKLDDPDNIATRHLDLDWGEVGDDHTHLEGVMIPGFQWSL